MSKFLSETEPLDTGESLEQAMRSRSGQQWWMWLAGASDLMPDLARALGFLKQACHLLDECLANPTTPALHRKFKQTVGKYIGQARCPSAASCERIAVRAYVILGWMDSEMYRQPARPLLLEVGSWALQKLLQISEGADDKQGVLLKAVRTLTRQWLVHVAEHVGDPIERAHNIYPVAMLDQAGLVDPAWWWKNLADCDRTTVLALAEEEVRAMEPTQPSTQVNWRSFDKRWKRLRLRGLLEHLSEQALLSELLRKSAVDDFEAVEAIGAMQKAGRMREAIAQAEQWMRALPTSPGLGQSLFDLYANDGWDDEALALAVQMYAHDPNPAWIARLETLNTEAALAQAKAWRKAAMVR